MDEEEFDQEEDLLKIPLSWGLPSAGSINYCPKCGTELIESTRVYHKCGYIGQPCEKTIGYPQVQELGEHICRQCLVCGHYWVEATTGKREE